MPVKHDPAIRTPERIRAVAALHRLGVVHLFFVVGYILFHLTTVWRNLDFYLTLPYLPTILGIILIYAILPAIAGALAVVAATGICRQKQWGLKLGSETAELSGFILVASVGGFLLSAFKHFSFFEFFLRYCIVIFYLCAASVLTLQALLCCRRLRAAERPTDTA